MRTSAEMRAFAKRLKPPDHAGDLARADVEGGDHA
jgi:hypothetical protein